MSFDRLDYVMAIAEEQNMTKAAARLFISQPALTASINKLEEELGVKLFDRQRPPIKLTPAVPDRIKDKAKFEENINDSIRRYNPDYWRARQSGIEKRQARQVQAPAHMAERS